MTRAQEMMGDERGDGAPDADLTRRARIRNAALTRFAAHGFAGTTLRAIASDAGVTVGLIPHYFGSKSGLRDEVEAWVVDQFHQAIARADREAGDAVADARARDAEVARMLEDSPLTVDYLRRETLHLDGDGQLISRLVQLTRESVDNMRAAGQASLERSIVEQVVAVMVRQLGQLFLQPMVDRIVAEFPDEENPPVMPALDVGLQR